MKPATVIDLTPENIAEYGVCGYKDVKKHKELQKKIEWFTDFYPKGLRIKGLIMPDGSYQGMIEYIPAKYAHRPVSAEGYMFIHCIFCGFKSEYKHQGYGSLLIEKCIEDTKKLNMNGVAVVTRKGSFMADKDIFLKMQFSVCDTLKPDFELLVLKFSDASPLPRFNKQEPRLKPVGSDGTITIMRSPQCPYTEKNVTAMLAEAKTRGIETRLVELQDEIACQQSSCGFGTFCIELNGSIISHHPISVTRFQNILNSKQKRK